MQYRAILLLCVIFGIPETAAAQKDVSAQLKPVIHLQMDLNDSWFVPVWSITNLREGLPDNTNLLAGLGYRQKTSWWGEVMLQRQWNRSGDDYWMADVRVFAKPYPTVSVFLEGALFLNRRAFYNIAIVEWQITPRLSLGGETENFHRVGRDSLGVGPRMNLQFFRRDKTALNLAFAYQVRPRETDVARFYLVLNHRFSLRR